MICQNTFAQSTLLTTVHDGVFSTNWCQDSYHYWARDDGDCRGCVSDHKLRPWESCLHGFGVSMFFFCQYLNWEPLRSGRVWKLDLSSGGGRKTSGRNTYNARNIYLQQYLGWLVGILQRRRFPRAWSCQRLSPRILPRTVGLELSAMQHPSSLFQITLNSDREQDPHPE